MPRARRLIWIVAAFNVGVWMLFVPDDDGRSDFVRQVVAEVTATTAVILFGGALLLSTRARWLEPHLGGLDKAYRVHRETAVAGFLLLVSHVVLIPWRFGSQGGVPAGLIAFAGIAVLVVLAIGPRLAVTRRIVTMNYRSWRRTHWLIGFFFIFSLAHMLLVDSLVTTTPVPFILVMAAYVIGIGSFLYAILLSRLIRPRRKYVVVEANRLNETTLEVILAPKKKPVEHTAGQFVFVSFKGRRLREPHPFTVASSPTEPALRLTIKASGDFTQHLLDRLQPGVRAKVEGAYGMLDYKTGQHDQIWVAGGIGITPFLAWLKDIDSLHHSIDFFYTVRNPEDAVYKDDIADISGEHAGLRFHLWISAEEGSLTVDRILQQTSGYPSTKSVYMCGPVGMIKAFEKDFAKRGVQPDNIHYEEFSFR